jgi:sec-independent protein translocase protein TatA
MAVGPWQIVIVVLLILLVFGASRLSEIGKGLGEGIRQFKKGIGEDDEPKRSRRRTRGSEDDEEDEEEEDDDDDDEEPKRLESKKRRAKSGEELRERRHVRAKRSKRNRDADKERS